MRLFYEKPGDDDFPEEKMTENEEILWEQMIYEGEVQAQRAQDEEEARKMYAIVRAKYIEKGVSPAHMDRVVKAVSAAHRGAPLNIKEAILHEVIEKGVMTKEEVAQWTHPLYAEFAEGYYRGNRTLEEYYKFLKETAIEEDIIMYSMLDKLEYEYTEELVWEIKKYLLPILYPYDYEKVKNALLKKGVQL
jgi:hypothetical protein